MWLDPDDIFYSSGADTGVPDGKDLLAHVRDQVGETGLVIAILTPTFQTRPVCVAELGAAWATTGKLFPLLVPGMKRAELEGVLSTQMVDYMDNEEVLDRLHDRIAEVAGHQPKTATWTRFKQQWLRQLPKILDAGGVPQPLTVTVGEYNALVEERDGLIAAIAEVEDELEKTKQKLDVVAKLKDKQEVKQVTLPTEAVERFELLVEEAKGILSGLHDRYVARAVVATCSDQQGLRAPHDDRWERDDISALADQGWLVEVGDGIYQASDDFKAHTDAMASVERAIAAAADDDPDFVDWFVDKYEALPNLKNHVILQRVFLR